MDHQNHRPPLGGTEAAQQLEDALRPFRIQVIRRLVRQQHIVMGEKRTAEHQSALLTSG